MELLNYSMQRTDVWCLYECHIIVCVLCLQLIPCCQQCTLDIFRDIWDIFNWCAFFYSLCKCLHNTAILQKVRKWETNTPLKLVSFYRCQTLPEYSIQIDKSRPLVEFSFGPSLVFRSIQTVNGPLLSDIYDITFTLIFYESWPLLLIMK